MDRYCPECNSNMTPSLVGYLCPDCGNVQRFYTMTGTQLKSTAIPATKSSLDSDEPTEKTVTAENSINTQEFDDESRNKVLRANSARNRPTRKFSNYNGVETKGAT